MARMMRWDVKSLSDGGRISVHGLPEGVPLNERHHGSRHALVRSGSRDGRTTGETLVIDVPEAGSDENLWWAAADVALSVLRALGIRADVVSAESRLSLTVEAVPPGLGSHVQWDRRLDGLLAGAAMTTPGTVAVEVGDGFDVTTIRGSSAHDELFASANGIVRRSNHAGGIEGGMSNGMPILITIHLTRNASASAAPMALTQIAFTVGNAAIEKAGMGTIDQVRNNLAQFVASIPPNLRTTPEPT